MAVKLGMKWLQYPAFPKNLRSCFFTQGRGRLRMASIFFCLRFYLLPSYCISQIVQLYEAQFTQTGLFQLMENL